MIPLDVECPIEKFTYLIVSNATENQQNSIDQLSTQISNGKDVENLLDYVKWRMFIYSCVENQWRFLIFTVRPSRWLHKLILLIY